MFVELCLVLRIVLNEGEHIVLRNVSIVPCAATREPLRDQTQKTIVNPEKEEIPDVIQQDGNSRLKFLWAHKPSAQAPSSEEYEPQPVVFRQPHSLTKLAKTLAYGFDPSFSKGSFEPFERRAKPVTLVALRKNGLIPRKTVKNPAEKSSGVAELQSPFNEISNFWMDVSAERNPI